VPCTLVYGACFEQPYQTIEMLVKALQNIQNTHIELAAAAGSVIWRKSVYSFVTLAGGSLPAGAEFEVVSRTLPALDGNMMVSTSC
jgi:hypothetical protein